MIVRSGISARVRGAPCGRDLAHFRAFSASPNRPFPLTLSSLLSLTDFLRRESAWPRLLRTFGLACGFPMVRSMRPCCPSSTRGMPPLPRRGSGGVPPPALAFLPPAAHAVIREHDAIIWKDMRCTEIWCTCNCPPARDGTLARVGSRELRGRRDAPRLSQSQVVHLTELPKGFASFLIDSTAPAGLGMKRAPALTADFLHRYARIAAHQRGSQSNPVCHMTCHPRAVEYSSIFREDLDRVQCGPRNHAGHDPLFLGCRVGPMVRGRGGTAGSNSTLVLRKAAWLHMTERSCAMLQCAGVAGVTPLLSADNMGRVARRHPGISEKDPGFQL